MKTIEDRLLKLLYDEPKYFIEENLNNVKIIEDLKSYDKKLISKITSDNYFLDNYTFEINEFKILRVEELISELTFNKFWDNSYTKFENTIGLTSEDKYLKYNSDVVIDFPYKDCILEAGMTKEDLKKDEVFYNKILAKNEIDILLSPKVLNNPKKLTNNGYVISNQFDKNDNLIIKGNNLITLHTLNNVFNKKIDVIYIDPPYNTGGDANIFTYNNKFNHSTWLTFMKNRLEIAHELLAEDGFLLMAIDDAELFYLGVLTDEIFGRENFIGNITVVHKPEGRNMEKFIATSTEYMLVYAKNKAKAKFNKMFINSEKEKEFEEYSDEIGSYKLVNYLRSGGGNHNLRENKPNFYYPIYVDNDTLEVYSEYKENSVSIYPITSTGQERTWKTIKATFEEKLKENRIKAIKDNKENIIICEKYYKHENGDLIKSHWTEKKYNAIHSGTKLLENIIGSKDFSYPKSLYLVEDALKMTLKNNGTVLDFFGGSGTTGHAVINLNKKDNGNRQFILCEQLDEHINVMLKRFEKLKENGDIKNSSIIYTSLFEINQFYIDKILKVENEENFNKILNEIKNQAYLNFKLDLENFHSNFDTFKALNLEEKKKILIDALDINQLYLSYSEIEDEEYSISNHTKSFNDEFFNSGDKNE
ncbi:DNA methyltransferase [Staphylococcus epidermidis]